MSIFSDSWKTIFGDSGDAVDEAGDAQQERIVQAIDLINRNLDTAAGHLELGKDTFIQTINETLSKVRSEIIAGNTETAQKLRDGLDEQYSFLANAYGFQRDELVNAYKIIESDLNSAEAESTTELTNARDQARTDIETGRDTAVSTLQAGKTEVRGLRNDSIGRLRESLTNSLNAISRGEDKASQAINSSLERTRANYSQYVNAGNAAITRAEQLTNDPQAQLDYVQNNPFFSTMQETARDQLFANNAAKGRLGTGGTLDELDKRTLLLGEQLVGNSIERNLGISGQGLNAINNLSGFENSGAALLANIFQNSANAEVNANTNFGNVGANVDANAASNLSSLTQGQAGVESSTGNTLGNVETRFGENLSNVTQDTVGRLSEVGVNFTGMLNNNSSNATGQYSNALTSFNNLLAQMGIGETSALANSEQSGGAAKANAYRDHSFNLVDLINGGTGSVVNLLNALGTSEANEVIGEQNAQTQGFNTLLSAGLAIAGLPQFSGTSNNNSYSPLGSISVSPQNSVGPIAPQYGGYQPPPYNPNLFQFGN